MADEEQNNVENTEEEQKKKEQRIFAVRVILWSLFSCIFPVCLIGWRYELFNKVGAIQLSGWGLIAVILIVVFLFVVIKYLRAGFVEWSMTKQIISGVVKIILPLVALLSICVSIKNSLDIFIQSLSGVLILEVFAIPLNPFPEWVWKKSQGRFESAVDFVADKLYNRNKDNKGE